MKMAASFKTVKGSFGLERFAQSRRQGVFCFRCFSALTILLGNPANSGLPNKASGRYPDPDRWATTRALFYSPMCGALPYHLNQRNSTSYETYFPLLFPNCVISVSRSN